MIFTAFSSSTITSMPAERTRKPRTRKPYARKPGPKPKQKGAVPVQALAVSKAAPKHRRKNLPLEDWITVFDFADAHPSMSQEDVADHFRGLHEGTLKFSQSALSRRLRQRNELLVRANSTPTALASKRPRIVTRPDVERALVMWTRHRRRRPTQE